MKSLLITNEGPLTEEDKQALAAFRGSEVFRLARKLCSHEYHVVCELITTAQNSNDLLIAQGQLRGIKQVYALLMFNATALDDNQKNNSDTILPDGRKIRNMKSS